MVGDAHDSTVKFRPVDPADVGPKWRKFRDFKIEADASETALVKSASFSMPVAKGRIKRVAGGKKPIAAIFTAEQEEFLATMAGRKIDFARLAVLGPLLAQRWQFEDPGCPWPITAELWKRGDGKRLMEVSIKAPAVQAAVAVGGFMAFLAEVGAERDKEPADQDALGARLLRRATRAQARAEDPRHQGIRRQDATAIGAQVRLGKIRTPVDQEAGLARPGTLRAAFGRSEQRPRLPR